MRAQKVSQPTGKICFVIAPVGDIGSVVRIRSDKVLKHIIAPAVTECGYDPLRADQISEPGIITSQVIQHLVEDPLVIADLTGPNANVFYELAVRHAVRMPVVQIIDAAESIPFDVAANRTISFDYRDLDSAERAREEIERQIKAVEKNPKEVDTPLTLAVELQSLRRSENPLEKSAADIMAMLQDLKAELNEIRRTMKRESSGEVVWLNPVTGKGISGYSGIDSPSHILPGDALKLYLEKLPPTPPPETGKGKKGT